MIGEASPLPALEHRLFSVQTFAISPSLIFKGRGNDELWPGPTLSFWAIYNVGTLCYTAMEVIGQKDDAINAVSSA